MSNNYMITVNGKQYLVLNASTKLEALSKISDKIDETDQVMIEMHSSSDDVFCLNGDGNISAESPTDEKKRVMKTETPPPKPDPDLFPQQPQWNMMNATSWNPNMSENVMNQQMKSPTQSLRRSEPIGYPPQMNPNPAPAPSWTPPRPQ